ncbi:MAG: hypothetical protein JWO82_462 [Akkermansiaceae bacterium]|nr:hypothetical protein [Akkermansiaceae bacterium]
MAEINPASSPPPLAAAPMGNARKAVTPLSDFHDRLSPMLVKELRQGLRAKTFVSVFLALQGFLAFVLLTAAGGMGTGTSGGGTISSIIFFFFSIAALVIQPLRGIGALHGEIKENTIELMVLTRLSSWRIVLGKWVSIYSQTALLFIAIIPYLILRYFFGGMQLFSELLMMGTVFFLSGVFTAFTVGLSAVPSILIRGLLPLVGGVVLISFIWGLAARFGDVSNAFSLESAESRWVLAITYVAGSYLAWMALGLGASAIAPAAENHSTIRRVISLGCLLLVGLLIRFRSTDETVMVLLLGMTVVPAVILSLTEPFHLLPPVCAKFVKKGAAGVVAGRFLYPGWPSGTLFSIALIALAGLFFALSKRVPSDDTGVFLICTAGTLLFPAALLGGFQRRIKNRFAAYVIALVSTVLITLVAVAISSSMSSHDFLWAFCWVPPMPFFLREVANVPTTEAMTTGAFFTGIYAIAALLFAIRQSGPIRQVEEQTRQYNPPS